MPLPTPKKNENKQSFIDRCMGDDEAVSDFPENDQRFAFCNSVWEQQDEKARCHENREGLVTRVATGNTYWLGAWWLKVESSKLKGIGHKELAVMPG